jgi:hypothetical protein
MQNRKIILHFILYINQVHYVYTFPCNRDITYTWDLDILGISLTLVTLIFQAFYLPVHISLWPWHFRPFTCTCDLDISGLLLVLVTWTFQAFYLYLWPGHFRHFTYTCNLDISSLLFTHFFVTLTFQAFYLYLWPWYFRHFIYTFLDILLEKLFSDIHQEALQKEVQWEEGRCQA